MKRTMRILPAALLLAPMLAWAQQAAPAAELPEWDRLTPAQRELLIAPVRERWNAAPADRASMYRHAERWQSMTPEQRARARRGMHRWEHMPAQTRGNARVIYLHLRGMDQDKRKLFLEQWKAMTPEQRQAWLNAQRPQVPPPRD